MSEHRPTAKVYYATGVALFLLLAATIVASKLSLGTAAPIVALGIAAAKAALVALFFMHLRYSNGISRLFAFAGLFWLVILMGITLADYLTRT